MAISPMPSPPLGAEGGGGGGPSLPTRSNRFSRGGCGQSYFAPRNSFRSRGKYHQRKETTLRCKAIPTAPLSKEEIMTGIADPHTLLMENDRLKSEISYLRNFIGYIKEWDQVRDARMDRIEDLARSMTWECNISPLDIVKVGRIAVDMASRISEYKGEPEVRLPLSSGNPPKPPREQALRVSSTYARSTI